jgi:quercetin dioxygenase-like cupin family protein
LTDPDPATARAVAAEQGESLWVLGTLVTLKVTGEQTDGRFSLWENKFPKGAAPPVHTHPEDESFFILEGEMTIWLDGERSSCGPGSFTFAPAGTPHTFRVDSETATLVAISTPAGIENFLRDVGTPAKQATLPPADAERPTDEQRAAAERANGMKLLGPPPGPDD